MTSHLSLLQSRSTSCLCHTALLSLCAAGPTEADSFQLEMSGLLSELACPYPALTAVDVTQRFLSRSHCLLLLSTFQHPPPPFQALSLKGPVLLWSSLTS